MQPDVVVALEPLAEVCEQLGLRIQIGGSVATSTYGVARATLDVDVVIDLPATFARKFADHLEDDYYVEAEAVRCAAEACGSFNLIHLGTMVKIDVFVPQKHGFSRESYSRGRVDTLSTDDDAREFSLATPEDMILHKLVWFELGERIARRQWDDVLGVLRVQESNLDEEYMDQWAEELGVADLLTQAREEAKVQG